MSTPQDGSGLATPDIQSESRDGTVVVTISGRACADAVDQVRTMLDGLRPAAERRLLLRLAALESCDPPVAWELLEFVRDVKDGGVEVVVDERPNAVVGTVLLLADVRDDLGLRSDGDGSRP